MTEGHGEPVGDGLTAEPNEHHELPGQHEPTENQPHEDLDDAGRVKVMLLGSG